FLAALPNEAKVVVHLESAALLLEGGGLERAPLSPNFAGTGTGALVSTETVGKRESNKLLDPLNPANPKILPSVDAAMWKARQLELGSVAALELSQEPFRRDLWSRLLEKAVARYSQTQGDAHEGTLALAA